MDIDDDMVEGEVKKRKIPKAAKVSIPYLDNVSN